MCRKVSHHTLNAWIYYVVIYTYLKLTPFFWHIAQCSVATCLGRGGIFKHEFVSKLLPGPSMKKWKSVNIWWNYGQEFGVLFFDSQCEVYRRRDLRTNGGGTPGRSSTQCMHDKLASTADRCRQLEVIDARRYDRSLLDARMDAVRWGFSGSCSSRSSSWLGGLSAVERQDKHSSPISHTQRHCRPI